MRHLAWIAVVLSSCVMPRPKPAESERERPGLVWADKWEEAERACKRNGGVKYVSADPGDIYMCKNPELKGRIAKKDKKEKK